MCTFLIMVMINKEDFAWQGRFLSPKLLSQMFLHCPSPRASPLVPHQGLLPPDRGPSSSEKWQKKNGTGGSWGFPCLRFHTNALTHPARLCFLCQTRASPPGSRQWLPAGSAVRACGKGQVEGDTAQPRGFSWGEFLIRPLWKPIG